jgi:hypothetical protein
MQDTEGCEGRIHQLFQGQVLSKEIRKFALTSVAGVLYSSGIQSSKYQVQQAED